MVSCAHLVLVLSFLKERAIMSRQKRLIYLSLVGITLLGLLVGVYLAAWKRFSKPAPSTTIIKHSVETPADDALRYWRADRMRNAKAAPLPHVTAPNPEKQQPHTSGEHQA